MTEATKTTRKTRTAWLAGDEDIEYTPTRDDLKVMIHEELCRFDDNAEIRIDTVQCKLNEYDPLCLVARADWQSAIRDCIILLWRSRARIFDADETEVVV